MSTKYSDSEFKGEFTPYEPEEAEEALQFIRSIITLMIEKVIPDKPRVLTFEKAGKCLRVLGKIWNLSEYPPVNYMQDLLLAREGDTEKKLMDMEGYVDEYQYLHIEAVDLSLTDIRILPQHFIWLLSADLSGNQLTNETVYPVTRLPNLVALRLNRNRFEDPYMPPMKHLQYLALNNNKIKSLHRIYQPNLETLDLNYNLIEKVDAEDCWKHTKLSQLELRGNLLATTSGIEYSSLVNLYLAENKITKLAGLEILVNLQRLHLRGNPLSDLSGFSASNINLKYLNIRKCQIESPEDLQNLSVLKGLKELIVKENLFNPEPEKQVNTEEDDYNLDDNDEEEKERQIENEEEEIEEDDEEIRIQILSFIPSLTRINKKVVTLEEKQRMRDMIETK